MEDLGPYGLSKFLDDFFTLLELYLAACEMGICKLLLNQKKGFKHINVIESRMLRTV